MARNDAGRDTGSVFRHPLLAMRRLSQRTPLRVKLITALLALVALALAVISFTSIAFFRAYLVDQSDNQLHKLISAATNQNPNGTGQGLHGNDLFTLAIQGYYLTVLDQDGNPVPDEGNSSAVQRLGYSQPVFSSTASWLKANANHPVTVPSASGGEDWRLIEQSVRYPDDDGVYQPGTLVVAASMGSVDKTIGFLTTLDVVVSVVIMLGLAVVSVAVVRTNLRPLDDIEETAQDIAAGHLDRRVPDRDPRTEVGRLGQSINTMLAQIEMAFLAQRQSEEAAVQSEERMRRFIADASHELRTPLTAIRGFAEYYRQRGGAEGSGGSLPGEDLDRIMQRVESEAARMGVLVEDLLQLARLDQQRPIEHQPVDLLVLAADSVQDTKMIAPGRPVKLDVEPGQAFIVNGDEARLRQVIGNLMANALTHTPDGTAIEVRLRPGFLPGPAPYPGAPAVSIPAAVLDVADHGPGLTAEQAQKVFERFYRADEARNRKNGGSGLGLAIVSAMVAAHGGTATVESAPGQGATFRITLPLDAAAAAGRDDEEEDEVELHGAESDTVSFGN
jgi:two-component system, OmpR family, sensor kinase